jgi:hypothetical protein
MIHRVLNRGVAGILGRPVKPGEDSGVCVCKKYSTITHAIFEMASQRGAR